jgi:hypothetical protein
VPVKAGANTGAVKNVRTEQHEDDDEDDEDDE